MVTPGVSETSENPTVTVSALPATAETGAAGCDAVIAVAANALSGATTKKRATSSPRRKKLVDIFSHSKVIMCPFWVKDRVHTAQVPGQARKPDALIID
jgi:hypothetical protein